MAYIKSRSKFVAKSKHQLTNGGSIWERDITTIGGLNTFDKNQMPIYQSGNFIITVNTDAATPKYIKNQGWFGNENGDTWTLANVNSATNSGNTQDTLKIELKPDYHNLKDFAYYGSCSELIRASIGNIVNTFPGELCVAIKNNEGVKVYYEDSDKNVQTLGDGEFMYLVDNPFRLDLVTETVPKAELDTNPLKYLATPGVINNYDFITANDGINLASLTLNINRVEKSCFKIGDKVADISINADTELAYLQAYVGPKNEIIYLTNKVSKWSLRPKTHFFNKFYKELDIFEKTLVNKNTTPKYTATFEVTTENDYTWETQLKNFTFPTSYGDYNLSVNSSAFTNYVKSLVEVGEYYDEHFCDNLYRCMTHESIKNLDFSYSRKYSDSDNEAYLEGGEKMQKALRLIAREFDEIKFYIDNIKSSTTLTYDNVNNLPDYFLTDVLDIEGWDIQNIHPYKYSNEKFSRDLVNTIKPYSKENFMKYPNGYFISCCNDDKHEPLDLCKWNALTSHVIISANESDGLYFFDDCAKESRPRIKPYTTETEYTMDEVNNHFMKMLKLNSRHILRHKGTIDGIEMMLGLFGLKSEKFVSGLNVCNESEKNSWDYKITEYTTFATPIEDKKDNSRGMHLIDWYNSTKSESYSSEEFLRGEYVPYQGLPVSYWEQNDETRLLFPYFNEYMEIDGKPHYQMNGGWLYNKSVSFDKDDNVISGETSYKETVDTIRSVHTLQDMLNTSSDKLSDGSILYVENLTGEYIIIDGKVYPLLKETISGQVYDYFEVTVYNRAVQIGRTIFRDDLWVSNPNQPISDWMNGEYIPLYNMPNDVIIRIYIIGKNIKNTEGTYTQVTSNTTKTWPSEENTFEQETSFGKWKYIFEPNNDETELGNITTQFTPHDSYVLIDSFGVTYDSCGIFSGGSQYEYVVEVDASMKLQTETSGKPTHYFMLDEVNNKYDFGLSKGWKQLRDNDPMFYVINSIIENDKGNNPHKGNMKYDNGFEYISYFTTLFKHALKANSFDSRCYSSKQDYTKSLDDIKEIGFTSLINDQKPGEYNLIDDIKVHYFGNIISGETTYNDKYVTFKAGYDPKYFDSIGDNKNMKTTYKKLNVIKGLLKHYQRYENEFSDNTYSLKDIDTYKNINPQYGFTNQIMNTKVVELEFKVAEQDLKNYKYLESVIIPYVSQMVPSTTILKIKYS